MNAPHVTLLDYGMGNLASVAKALERAGADVRLTDAPETVGKAGALVLPGVGGFGDAAARLRSSGLADAVLERIGAGVPFLGVCLGLQLLFEGSDEGPGDGLGVFTGRVERIATTLKVPQIGWNELRFTAAGAPLAEALEAPVYVYFVHSYVVRPADDGIVAATCDFDGDRVAAVVRDNVWAVQFHPEKSSATGLCMLRNWLAVQGKETRA